MAGRIDFRKIETPTEFQQICERLLARMFPDFHPVNQAGGDGGIDGFAVWGDQLFQFTHTQRNVPLQKLRSDFEKVTKYQGLRTWYFLCSQPLTQATWQFVESQKSSCRFEIVIWEGAKLKELISRHRDIVDEFFPEFAKKAYEGTRAIQKDLKDVKRTISRARRRPPMEGDAPEGLEIGEVEKGDISDLIWDLAMEEARRRSRRAKKARQPITRQNAAKFVPIFWAEFNRKYHLSSYDRLPKAKFGQAIEDLKTKLFTKRNNEPGYLKIERQRKGIYGIAKDLGWDEEQRRRFYLDQTGKDSLTEMTRDEIRRLYEALRALQDGKVPPAKDPVNATSKPTTSEPSPGASGLDLCILTSSYSTDYRAVFVAVEIANRDERDDQVIAWKLTFPSLCLDLQPGPSHQRIVSSIPWWSDTSVVLPASRLIRGQLFFRGRDALADDLPLEPLIGQLSARTLRGKEVVGEAKVYRLTTLQRNFNQPSAANVKIS